MGVFCAGQSDRANYDDLAYEVRSLMYRSHTCCMEAYPPGMQLLEWWTGVRERRNSHAGASETWRRWWQAGLFAVAFVVMLGCWRMAVSRTRIP